MIWIIGGAVAWAAIALPVGILIGKSIAEADRVSDAPAPTGKLPHLTLVRDAG